MFPLALSHCQWSMDYLEGVRIVHRERHQGAMLKAMCHFYLSVVVSASNSSPTPPPPPSLCAIYRNGDKTKILILMITNPLAKQYK